MKKPPPLFRWRKGPSPSGQFITIGKDGIPDVWLHEGQDKARRSKARFVLVLSGAQSGKTALGPPWLLEQMQERGPGNYILVAPTFRLLEKQAIPTLNRFFGTLLKLGSLVGNEFRISEEGHARIWPHLPYEPTRIIFGYAENPDSLESLTAKAAWLDEAGQKSFKQTSWEAIQSRLAINQGRVLFTSTPYEHNWLKTDVYDRADRNRRAYRDGLPRNPADSGYDSVSYESIMNPAFPKEEWERQKLVLPRWRFDMRYRGRFTRPAGAVYDCWRGWIGPDEHGVIGHVVPPFNPPAEWPRYVGLDFGSPNFAAVFVAEELDENGKPSGRLCVYREYSPDESKKIADHIIELKRGESKLPLAAVGGSKSEGNWRIQFADDGYPVNPPDQPDVEVGIIRVYGMIQTDQLFVTSNCERLIDDLDTYSREIDDAGNILNDISDKETFHRADALRYVIGWLRQAGINFFFKVIETR